MKLPYTGEIIENPDGIPCKVLDTAKVDDSTAVEGRKTALTLVRRAEGGELIETLNDEGTVESTYTTKPGDAIFINLHNHKNIYVPGEPDGTRWQFKDLESHGYEITGDDHENGGILVRSTATAKLLHEAVEEPTCIKDAWGEGKHLFLFNGATLKVMDNHRITGIEKASFDATWEITSKEPEKPSGTPRTPRAGNG